MKLTYCDRCGKRLPANADVYTKVTVVNSGPFRWIDIALTRFTETSGHVAGEICEKCATALRAAVEKWASGGNANY